MKNLTKSFLGNNSKHFFFVFFSLLFFICCSDDNINEIDNSNSNTSVDLPYQIELNNGRLSFKSTEDFFKTWQLSHGDKAELVYNKLKELKFQSLESIYFEVLEKDEAYFNEHYSYDNYDENIKDENSPLSNFVRNNPKLISFDNDEIKLNMFDDTFALLLDKDKFVEINGKLFQFNSSEISIIDSKNNTKSTYAKASYKQLNNDGDISIEMFGDESRICYHSKRKKRLRGFVIGLQLLNDPNLVGGRKDYAIIQRVYVKAYYQVKRFGTWFPKGTRDLKMDWAVNTRRWSPRRGVRNVLYNGEMDKRGEKVNKLVKILFDEFHRVGDQIPNNLIPLRIIARATFYGPDGKMCSI